MTSSEPIVGVVGATGRREISRRTVSGRASKRAFFGVSTLLFAASAAVTIVWCASMPEMGQMPMSGGWTMSMAWMLMPGQTWPGAAASFLGMWVVMMAAMMLPSLVPMLWRYRQVVARTGGTRLGRLTALVALGYFLVWTAFGMVAFPLGVALAEVEMQMPALARTVPMAAGVVVLMTILLVIGVMDLRAMAVVTAAITVERLAPAGARVARAIEAVVVGAGLFLIARAAGLG